jgi:hypothetical protein
MKKTALLLSIALLGCTSATKEKEHQPQPPPRVEAQPAQEGPAQAQGEPKGEPIAISMKKGDKRTPEAAYQGAPPPGYVCFDFKDVDLEKVAMPLFSNQAGIKIEYHGPSKNLTMRFDPPVKWQEALGLLCQWTQTHVTRSNIAGRLELKLGYADPAPFLAKYDPNDASGTDAGAGVLYGSPDAVGNAPPINTGATKQPAEATDTASTSQQPGADRIDEIRKNVTPTSSGAK